MFSHLSRRQANVEFLVFSFGMFDKTLPRMIVQRWAHSSGMGRFVRNLDATKLYSLPGINLLIICNDHPIPPQRGVIFVAGAQQNPPAPEERYICTTRTFWGIVSFVHNITLLLVTN